MKFLKNNVRRVNLNFIKEFEVNEGSNRDTFSIQLIDGNDNINTIDVNIRDMIDSEGFKIEESAKRILISEIKDECWSRFADNDLFYKKDEIDISDIVYDCYMDIVDMYNK